jgi:hypothetical protein
MTAYLIAMNALITRLVLNVMVQDIFHSLILVLMLVNRITQFGYKVTILVKSLQIYVPPLDSSIILTITLVILVHSGVLSVPIQTLAQPVTQAIQSIMEIV